MSEVRIPYRDRSQPLDGEALSLPDALPDARERRIATQILCDAMATGMRTVGDVIRTFERASPDERRQIVDRARTAAGMETIGREEAGRAFERRLAAPQEAPRDSAGQTAAICSVDGCHGYLPHPNLPGEIALTSARRWTCEKHADQGDFAVRSGPRLAY